MENSAKQQQSEDLVLVLTLALLEKERWGMLIGLGWNCCSVFLHTTSKMHGAFMRGESGPGWDSGRGSNIETPTFEWNNARHFLFRCRRALSNLAIFGGHLQ